MVTRSVSRIIEAIPTLEHSFPAHSAFPAETLSDFDPFLLLDEMGPMQVVPREAKGAPELPYRGFETVTYMFSGSFRLRDSHGHEGRLEAGDVEWMTNGSGIIHSEAPSPELQRTGGTLHGLQLWINLSKSDKMIRPRYQEISATKIPVAQTPDGDVVVRVLAGEFLGVHAVIETRTPILYLDFTLKPGGSVFQPVARDFNAFAYIIQGPVLLGQSDDAVQRGNMVAFNKDGEAIRIEAPPENRSPARVVLIGGQPLYEPIARYGPFVMNTEEEIQQAFDDYYSGRMDSIEPPMQLPATHSRMSATFAMAEGN